MTTNYGRREKFLVLIDFSEDSYKALDDLIKLVKEIGGSIEVFSILSPLGIMDKENQITALRTMDMEEKRVERKLNSIVEMIELEGIKANSSYSIGNVKSELKLKLIKSQPDVMVLAKKGNFANGVLHFLINEYKNAVLILGNAQKFFRGNSIAIGYEDKTFNFQDFQLIYKISRATEIKMTLLRTVASSGIDHSTGKSDWIIENIPDKAYSSVNYHSNSDLTGALLKNSLSKDVVLLCIGKNLSKKALFRNPFKNSTTFKIVKNTRVPLLIMGVKNESLMV